MFVNQKTQEITYALVRIAPYVRRQELRHRIERLAFQLLEEVSSENFEAANKTVSSLESFISLGKAIYEIEPVNAKIIAGELRSLGSALKQILGIESDSSEAPDVANLFSKVPAVLENQTAFNSDINNAANPTEEKSAILPNSGNSNGNSNGMAATIRQSAILEKIRQSANGQIQLKDLIAAFPEVSERTMRYDLQKLCAQGLVERVGTGGPGSYYVLKS